MSEGNMTTPQAELSAEVVKVLEQQAHAEATPSLESRASGSSAANTESLKEKVSLGK